MKTVQKLGFLQMCADRRFHAVVERKFQEATGLSEIDYWIEATAGGTPTIEDPKTADYAYAHGARVMGWAAHGSNCGGFPGVSDEEMKEKLRAAVGERQSRYPDATHFKIFSDGTETTIEHIDETVSLAGCNPVDASWGLTKGKRTD